MTEHRGWLLTVHTGTQWIAGELSCSLLAASDKADNVLLTLLVLLYYSQKFHLDLMGHDRGYFRDITLHICCVAGNKYPFKI